MGKVSIQDVIKKIDAFTGDIKHYYRAGMGNCHGVEVYNFGRLEVHLWVNGWIYFDGEEIGYFTGDDSTQLYRAVHAARERKKAQAIEAFQAL